MMHRRRFLGAGVAGLMLPFGPGAWMARATAPLGEDNRRLIVIFLRGAVDGLNVVVPYGDDAYYAARRSIAIAPPGHGDGALDLDGHFGLHPALASLLPLWQAGKLGFVQGCGSPDPTRSHFDAQLFVENGTPGQATTPDGWMNRLLAILPGVPGPTRAIAFGPQIPRILAGPQAVAMMALGAAAGRPLAIDRPEVALTFSRLYAGTDPISRIFQDGVKSRQQMQADLAADDGEQRVADGGAPLPTGFPADAARLAHMMRQDGGIRLAFFDLGGWDTHVNQGGASGQLANRLRPLGDGLAALAGGLGAAFADSLILVVSEFGRTLRENGNGGTDHGHGTVLWALGGGVAGGKVHGIWPGLSPSQLYQQRDLAVTTDFRSAIGPAVVRHLRLPETALARLFPGAPALGRIALMRT